MAKGIRKVDYYVLHTNDQPGEGAHLLKTLKKHKVNLLALTAYPMGGGSQVDLIPEKPQQLIDLAKKFGWKLSSKKTGFMARGKDRAGALVKLAATLADAGVNITAVDAISAGADRYGAIFWVNPKDVSKAARLLGAG